MFSPIARAAAVSRCGKPYNWPFIWTVNRLMRRLNYASRKREPADWRFWRIGMPR